MQLFSTRSKSGQMKTPPSRARGAWAQPRFLLGGAALALAGATWAALAAPTLKAPASKSAVPFTLSDKPADLSALPGMVAHYGESRRLAALAKAKVGGRTTNNVGTGQTGFNLVETDLTPNSPSDEREPIVSPSGDFIAFTSTGADSTGVGRIDSLNANGTKHIWIMNRDGSSQRQVTGLGADATRNQSHPTWSPDGNQIAYSDEDTDLNGGNVGGSQLWVVPAVDPNPTPSQRTFFRAENGTAATVTSPAWSPSGLSIAFVTNYDGRASTANGSRILPTRDIFTIAPDGTTASLTRVTGGSQKDAAGKEVGDPVGNSTDDNHPAWATVNTNVLLFSSNRDANGPLTGAAAGGRRIWRVLANGSYPNQVSDPTKRAQGAASDADDYPAPSLSQGDNVKEKVAFQSNTYLDASDKADGARGHDLNIWSLIIDSTKFTGTLEEPRIYVGSYTDGQIVGVNARTLGISSVVPRLPVSTFNSIPLVEDVVASSDGQYVYAADRTNARVDRFNEADGSIAGNPNFNFSFTPATAPVKNPTGIAAYGGYLYVASGYQNSNPTQTLYRFYEYNGTVPPNGNDPKTGAFSNGETAANGGTVTNGAEGVAIDPNGRYIAVAALIDNKINLYDLNSGTYLFEASTNTSLVPSDSKKNGGLNLPTGLAWGPDFNGDGFPDLYACSSGDDSIKVYAGPDPSLANPFPATIPNGEVRAGSFLGNLVQSKTNGSDNGLNAPERIKIVDIAKHDTSGSATRDTFGKDNTYEVYVSSFSAPGSSTPGDGYQVLRFELDTTNQKAYSWPAGAGVPSASSATDAAYISLPTNPADPNQLALNGAASFSFSQATLDQANGFAAPVVPDEGTTDQNTGRPTISQVVTNILSSPDNFTASRLPSPQSVDRSADREPSFSRSTASSQTLARVVFSSGRKYALTPDVTTPINPYGGDQSDAGVTHDIWVTSSQDTTPPALVPQGVGNLKYPVVAPQPNAPFFAPRTAEVGLQPGLTPTAAEQAELAGAQPSANTYAKRGGLRFAIVLRDVESGLQETSAKTPPSSVRVSFYNADSPQFDSYITIVNEGIMAQISPELKASAAIIGGVSSFALNVYDDGPVSAGGHEQEAGAVAGDGNYYCEGVLPTPPAGDYYIDVTAIDRALNSFTYDNIWGFSTRRFIRQSNSNSDLFVSDYTCGQNFPFQLGNDVRFANMPPVESYYLTNPPGIIVKSLGPPIMYGASSNPTTFSNLDIWRILCRGPVTQDVLNSYRPTIAKQIDPTTPYPSPAPTATPLPGVTPAATPLPTATPLPGATPAPTAIPTATPLPYTQLTRNVSVNNSFVIWAAPYAGTTFVGPGTITDSTTQSNLTSFLNDGGRLFLSGRSIAWALSSGGSLDNTFLNTELAAKYAGQNSANGLTLTAAPGGSFLSNEINFVPQPYSGGFVNLQFPFQIIPGNPKADTYADGALNQDIHSGNGLFDLLKPQNPSGSTVTPDYLYNGSTVGQRVVRSNRNNNLESRTVYFGFGFEAVNRRYTGDKNYPPAMDIRFRLGRQILRYLKTTGLSGKVTNQATNLPVANFLVQVDGPNKSVYFARTDLKGQYSLTGLPGGSYTAKPYIDGVGLTSPQGFFGGTPTNGPPPFVLTGGDPTVPGYDLVVIPAIPGAVIGQAVTSNGTFNDRSDDTPIPNLPVLIKSVQSSSIFPGGGKFVRLTTTNASGQFSLAGVPAKAEMQVIFNPNNYDPTKGEDQDIPKSSNITFSGHVDTYGRRVLPDTKRPVQSIIVPSGDNFTLNDTGTVVINGVSYTVDANTKPDTPADERVPVIVPTGPTLSGVVTVNGTPTANATAQLFTTDPTPVPVVNPVQTKNGSGVATGSDGAFSFVDVKATTRAKGGTKYTLRVSVIATGATLVRTIPITLYQGEDQAQTIDFALTSLTGNVVFKSNGLPASGATVMLQTASGATFAPSRTATTAKDGTYTLANIPGGDYTYDATAKTFTYTPASGGTVNYTVAAALSSQTGSSPVSVGTTSSTPVSVPTIFLVNQQLSGVIQYQLNQDPIIPCVGARVELLNASGSTVTSLTTGADGAYGFTVPAAGTYSIRSTYKGDTTTSAPFSAPTGAFAGPTLLMRLRIIYGATFDGTKPGLPAIPGVTVNLLQAGKVLFSVISDGKNVYEFPPVPAGNYTLTASKPPLSGMAQVPPIARVAAVAVGVPVYLYATSASGASSFDKGHTYAISTPYATSPNSTPRNSYDRSSNDATIALSQAFNYPPNGLNAAGNTVRFYSVSRFNPNTFAYEPIADSGNLVRGEGYLLQVFDVPANGDKLHFLSPTDNSSLKTLAVTPPTFTISLVWNSSTSANGLNGRNFIGFPFDPAKYPSVNWDADNITTDPTQASVNIIDGSKTYTIKQAVAASIIYPSITTVDGPTGRSVTSSSVAAYTGYFVTARKAGLKLRFQSPQPAPGN